MVQNFHFILKFRPFLWWHGASPGSRTNQGETVGELHHWRVTNSKPLHPDFHPENGWFNAIGNFIPSPLMIGYVGGFIAGDFGYAFGSQALWPSCLESNGRDEICCLKKKFERRSRLQYIQDCVFFSALYFCTFRLLKDWRSSGVEISVVLKCHCSFCIPHGSTWNRQISDRQHRLLLSLLIIFGSVGTSVFRYPHFLESKCFSHPHPKHPKHPTIQHPRHPRLDLPAANGGRSAPGASRPVALAAACGAAAHAAGRPQGRARVRRGPTGAVDGTAQNCRSLGKTAWIEWWSHLWRETFGTWDQNGRAFDTGFLFDFLLFLCFVLVFDVLSSNFLVRSATSEMYRHVRFESLLVATQKKSRETRFWSTGS